MTLEEIKPHCDRFNEWINTKSKIKVGSLGSQLSKYGFYKKFESVTLLQDKNAIAVPKHDAQGNVNGTKLRHYAIVLCGLTKEQWNERNQSTRVIQRLENSTEIDPDTYLETTGKLLTSDDPHELAVGLIAATGRRPHEIIARAKFTVIKDKPYHVMFEGQGKKRHEKPVFEIATLYPADYVVKALAKLRKEASTQALLKEVATQFPKSITRQNVEIDNRRGQSLRRVVRAYFGDRGQQTPVLAFRHGDEADNNKALRAAYAVLATERDVKGGYGAKILNASRILGHYTPAKEDDRSLTKLATSVGYSDYYITKPVPFPTAPQPPQKEKLITVRVTESDFQTIAQTQKRENLPNQQSAVRWFIDHRIRFVLASDQLSKAKNEIALLQRQLKEAQEINNRLSEENAQLQKEKAEMNSEMSAIANQSQENIDSTDLEALVERVVERKLREILEAKPVQQVVNEPATVTPAEPKPIVSKEKESVVDWELKTNEELWSTRVSGAANEKIRRSFQAICLYNDTLATGDNDRLAVTNLALRELSGVNGWLIGDWIKSHADEIISHHAKYEMQNSKDPSKVETYYNKRHGKEKIEQILKTINEKFLDGFAKV
ncbi:hypothetical protein SD81_028195 [Tolypothrix campylonemoides VB511288]|nr:hypothetical protein SD81_028195 [Tolypothrix campylonemoides VB511288]